MGSGKGACNTFPDLEGKAGNGALCCRVPTFDSLLSLAAAAVVLVSAQLSDMTLGSHNGDFHNE
jgi:hypothetical protein